ncbi:MAG: hypothetical protein AMXMBFR82_50100 [Candidatus Hydrogenedentota bacterium]
MFNLANDVVEAVSYRLRKRRDEVDVALRAAAALAGGHIGGRSPEAACSDAEEALRLCMVKYMPRLAGGKLSPDQLDEYLDLLHCVSTHCGSTDLRYLDALNVAYEQIQKHPDLISADQLQRFLLDYLNALSVSFRALCKEEYGRAE